MSTESHNIEWKSTWRDEYLKWIAGFANAQGGTLFIGKNNAGDVIGVDNAEKLLEDIPNKVRDVLGIVVNVNLHIENDLKFIEVVVDPYPTPVSYKGQYHYRSGSTKQELKGAALDKFILEDQKTSEKTVGETVAQTVGETVGEILLAIKGNPKITREELRQLTGLSIRGVEWNLAKLKAKGVIERIGPTKGGHWEVTKKPEKGSE